jgi:hypothetical protein
MIASFLVYSKSSHTENPYHMPVFTGQGFKLAFFFFLNICVCLWKYKYLKRGKETSNYK